MKPLLLISPWFGAWPDWMNFFVESCKWNPDVDWLIPTDQVPPENEAPNVNFQVSTLEEYKRKAGRILGVDLSKMTPYKLCDLKPCLGLIHEDDMEGHRSFGYCDIDVIFGDIRAIYSDSMLAEYEAISALDDRMSGHLAVFPNTPRLRSFFKGIRNWQGLLEESAHFGMDEAQFTHIFRPRKRRIIKRLLAPKSLFVNRYATPGGPTIYPDGKLSPSEWSWYRGKLSHERGGEDSVYLHMMRWQSSRWRKPGDPAPWPSLPRIVQCDWREAATFGFSISPDGIRLLA